MKFQVRVLATLCISFLLHGFYWQAVAQSPDKILKQAVKAMTAGKGEKPLREIRSWQTVGTITNVKSGEAGNFTASALAPNLYTTAYDIRGLETSLGYNGKSGWTRDSRDGLRTLTGQAARDFQAEAAFRNGRWLNYKREKSKLAFAGTGTINGIAANAVVITTSKNIKIKLHFDATTGLLLREEMPAGEGLRVFDYSDYRPVNGLQEAHAIKATLGAQEYEIKLSEIWHNPTVETALFDFPRISNDPLPDIPTLLKEVGENEDKIDEILEKYTYTESITKRETDSSGQIKEKESEMFELTFYKGNRIRRRIAKNGKPLTPDEEADENKRIEKRIREIEKKETERAAKNDKEREVAQEKTGTPDGDRGQRLSIADVLRASKLVNPRRERFRGRDVIVFDFEPLPDYKPQKSYEKFFGKNAGAIWVDAADKQVARVDARLTDSYKVAGGLLATLREGASFVLEQERVNDEIWLPTRIDINLGLKVLLIKGITVNQTITYGNYKRFNVDAEKEKLKVPGQAEEKPVRP